MSMGRSLFLVLGAVVTGLVAWGSASLLDARPKPPAQLENRLWIERLPKDERDLVLHLVLLQEQAGEVGGVLGKSSQFRVHVEVLTHKRRGDELTLYFPQDRERVRLKARTWRCEGKAPEPFQLCLELSAGRRKVRLYSRDDWTLPDGQERLPLPEAATRVPAVSLDDAEGASDAVVALPSLLDV